MRAKVLLATGVLALYQDDYARANILLEESLDLSRALPDRQGIAYALNAPGSDFDLGLMKTLIGDLKPANRLTTTFRFETANFALDSKATSDIIRLRNLLDAPEYRNKTVILAGFADGVGRFDSNLVLSNRRAASVLTALQRASPRPIGPQIVTKAYSQLAPIACNDSPEARSFNRRVEVWVK